MPLSRHASLEELSHSNDRLRLQEVVDIQTTDDETIEAASPITSIEDASDPLPPGDPQNGALPHAWGYKTAVPATVEKFANQFSTFGAWNYEGGDLVPLVLTRLTGWRASGVTLVVLQTGMPEQVFRPDPPGSSEGEGNVRADASHVITVRRINDCHYVPVVNGLEADQGADGNCLFYSVWHALKMSVPETTLRTLYEGAPPRDKTSAAYYFRSAGARRIRQEAAYFADFLVGEQPYASSEDQRTRAEEPQARLSSEEADVDEPSASVKGTRPGPPSSLTDIAKASLILAGNVATQNLVSLPVSLAMSVLPYSVSQLIISGWLAMQVLNDLARGDHVDALLDALLALPFELLRSFSLVPATTETMLGVLAAHVPWLLTTQEMFNFSVTKSATNLFVLTLVAAAYHMVVKKRISIEPGCHAQLFLRMVARLRKVSWIYKSVEASLLRQTASHDTDDLTAMTWEQFLRRALRERARETNGEDFPKKTNMTRQPYPIEHLASLRNGTASLVDTNPQAPQSQSDLPNSNGFCDGRETPFFSTGWVAAAHGDSATEEPFLSPAVPTLLILGGTLKKKIAVFIAFVLAMVAAAISLWDIIRYWMSLSGIPGAPARFPSSSMVPARQTFTGGYADPVVVNTSKEEEYEVDMSVVLEQVEIIIDSFNEPVEYDPVRWTFSDFRPEKQGNRTKRDAGSDEKKLFYEVNQESPEESSLSDMAGSANPQASSNGFPLYLNYSLAIDEFNLLNKATLNQTLTEFVSNPSLVTTVFDAAGDLASDISNAWGIFSTLLRGEFIAAELLPKEKVGDNRNIFSILRNSSGNIKKKVNNILKNFSSQQALGMYLQIALENNDRNLLRRTARQTAAVETLRAKFLEGPEVFPRLEAIFGENALEMEVENIEAYKMAVEHGIWDSTGSLTKDASARATQKYESDTIAYYMDVDLDPLRKIEAIQNEKGEIYKKMKVGIEGYRGNIRKIKSRIYVSDNSDVLKSKSLAVELASEESELHAYFQNYLRTIDFLEYLSRILDVPSVVEQLNKYKSAITLKEPFLVLWDAEAASMRLWFSIYPNGPRGNGSQLTDHECRNLYNKAMSDPFARNRNQLIYGKIIFYKLTDWEPDALVMTAPYTYSNLMKIADLDRDNPIREVVDNKEVKEAFELIGNVKSNIEIGDVAYYQQFSRINDKTISTVAAVMTLYRLLEACPDYYFLFSENPSGVVVYDFYGIKGNGKQDLDDLIGVGAAQKRITYDYSPNGQEKFPGNIIVIKYANSPNDGMFVMSTIWDKMQIVFCKKTELHSKALKYLYATSAAQLKLSSNNLIKLNDSSKLLLPRGTDRPIMGKSLREGFMSEFFGSSNADGYGIGAQSVSAAYLVFNEDQSAGFEGTDIFYTASTFFYENYREIRNVAKNNKFEFLWYHYALMAVPGGHTFYFYFVDPEFEFDRFSILTDAVDIFSTASGLTKAFQTLGRAAFESGIKKLTKNVIVKSGSVSTGAKLKAFLDIVSFWLPTGISPVTFSSKWTGIKGFFKNFKVQFDWPVIAFSKNGNVDWPSSISNFMFLVNLRGTIVNFYGRRDEEVFSEAEIKNVFNFIFSGRPVSDFIHSDSREKVEKFQIHLKNDANRIGFLKYGLKNRNGTLTNVEDAFYMEMKSGEVYVIDPSLMVTAIRFSTADAWARAVQMKAGDREIRAELFSSQDAAEKADLSGLTELPWALAELLAVPGVAFLWDGRFYLKTTAGEIDISKSIGIALYASPENNFEELVKGSHIRIPKNVLLNLPYIETRTTALVSDGGLIFCQQNLPRGIIFYGWLVGDAVGSKQALDDIMFGLAERGRDGEAREGEIFTRVGTRRQKIQPGDNIDAIALATYGDSRYREFIQNWVPNILRLGENFELAAGDELELPYAYLAGPAGSSPAETNEPPPGIDVASLIKYEFVDLYGRSSGESFAVVLQLDDGSRFIVDQNVKVAGSILSDQNDWEKAVRATNDDKRLRWLVFNDFEVAKNATLSDLERFPEEDSGGIEWGRQFISDLRRFGITEVGDTLQSMAKKYYGRPSMGNYFKFSSLNEIVLKYRVKENGEIEPGTVFSIPYISAQNMGSAKKTRMLISEVQLEEGLKYVEFKVGASLPAELPFETSQLNAPRAADGTILPGTTYSSHGARFHVFSETDTLASIIYKTYEVPEWDENYHLWSQMLADWGENIANSAALGWPRPGDVIALPYAYLLKT